MASANVDKHIDDLANFDDNSDLIDNADQISETIARESIDVPLEPLNTPWTFWIDR